MCIDKLTKVFILNCNDSHHWLNTILESNFFSSLIGALAGAIAGAIGAHWIAESQKNKQRLIEELRNTNTGIIVCADILELSINLKINHIKPLVARYRKDLKDFDDFQIKMKSDPLLTLNLSPQFNKINLPNIELSVFKNIFFEKISLDGKPLKLAFTSLRCLDFFAIFLAKYNEILDTHNNQESRTIEAIHSWYLAKQDDSGHTDRRFHDQVLGLEKYINDSIMYLRAFIGELEKHSQFLSSKFGEGAPKMPKVNLAKYVNNLPSYENYPNL